MQWLDTPCQMRCAACAVDCKVLSFSLTFFEWKMQNADFQQLDLVTDDRSLQIQEHLSSVQFWH